MQGSEGLLNVVTIPPGASITSPRLVLDGIRGAIFVYTSGGPLGALIGSWAGTAGTDPYGNTYPAGINVSSGSITGTVFMGTTFIMNASGLFFYSGTPANGNLIISIAPAAGTDAFGNNFPAGIEVFAGTNFTSSSGNFVTTLSAGELDFFFILFKALVLNASGLFLYVSPGGAGNLIASLAAAAGTDASGNTFPQGLFSQQLTLADQSVSPPAFTNASIYYSSSQGRPKFKASTGADNGIPRTDINTAVFSLGNNISPTAISAPLNYRASEGNNNSEYEIEMDGIITSASSGVANTLSFGVGVDAGILGGQFTIGAVFLPVAGTWSYTIRGRLTITTSGAGGVCNTVMDGQVSRQGVNAGSTTSPVPTIAVGAVGTGKSFDSTVAHTIQLLGFWGGANAGQQVQTFRSAVTRRS